MNEQLLIETLEKLKEVKQFYVWDYGYEKAGEIQVLIEKLDSIESETMLDLMSTIKIKGEQK